MSEMRTKNLLTAALLALASTGWGQEAPNLTLAGVPAAELSAQFLEVKATTAGLMDKRAWNIRIDAGQINSFEDQATEGRTALHKNEFRDETGEIFRFWSPIQVCNYLHEVAGYEIVSTAVIMGNGGIGKSYVMQKAAE